MRPRGSMSQAEKRLEKILRRERMERPIWIDVSDLEFSFYYKGETFMKPEGARACLRKRGGDWCTPFIELTDGPFKIAGEDRYKDLNDTYYRVNGTEEIERALFSLFYDKNIFLKEY